jgi:hypothetical protein
MKSGVSKKYVPGTVGPTVGPLFSQKRVVGEEVGSQTTVIYRAHRTKIELLQK